MLETSSLAIMQSNKSTPKDKLHHVDELHSYNWDGRVLTGTLTKGNFSLCFFNEKTMRIIWNPFGEVNQATSIAVSGKKQAIDGDLVETDEKIQLTFGEFEVLLQKKDFQIEVKKHGETVFQTSYPALSYTTKKHVYLSIVKNSRAPIYGLGEKTGYLDKNGSKISNWNTDVFNAHNKDTVELYQTTPIIFLHDAGKTTGIFFDNSFRTEFDMQTYRDKVTIMAEGGQVDTYVLLGNGLKEAVSLYTNLTGTTPLPPKWALGYHQSRNSYMSQEEVKELATTFKKYEIPVDCIYLDIHYMDGFRVFTFDENEFPHYKKMIKELTDQGIDVVPIVDPGIKKDIEYKVFQEGLEEDFFCKKIENKIYYGEVWPGECAFPDFFNSEVRDWWGNLHAFYTETGIRGIWNDMNEPALFNETKTMDLDVIHDYDGKKITHKEGHNLYGLFMSKATHEGLKKLLKNTRPFVLTRSGYSGIQRYAAVWTGDNRSYWEHLEMSLPMIMNMGMSGISFVGADVGGFSSDVTPELLIRWTQVGAFLPYFRNHSVQDSIRQEPWVFGEETMHSIKKYIELRYQFLPYIYTQFFEGEKTGLPIVRPLVMEYPNDKNTFHCSDQFLLGSQVIVAPLLRPGQTHRSVYLPEGEWYNFWTEEKLAGGKYHLIEADLDTLPIFIKAGTILPFGSKVNNTKEKQDIELLVYYSDKEKMIGWLYEDDGYSYAYRENQYRFTTFEMDDSGKLQMESSGDYQEGATIINARVIDKQKSE